MVETQETHETLIISDFTKNRLMSIDIFRGFTILLMIFVNLIAKYQTIPDWSKHGVGYTITYVDLVLPLFLFIMTLSFGSSYTRRLNKTSKKDVFIHFIRRYMIFILIGFIFTINFAPPYLRWGPLQVLGLSGLFLLPIIEFSTKTRLIIGGTLISIHQILIIPIFNEVMSDLWAGGIYSTLAWGGMMMISSVIAESLQNNKVKESLLVSTVVCMIAGILTSPIWGMSMIYTTVPYMLFSLGICTFCFLLAYIIFDDWGRKNNYFKEDNFLSILGKNAFIIYILHVVFRLVTSTLLSADTEITIVFTAVIINAIILLGIAYILNKNQKFIII